MTPNREPPTLSEGTVSFADLTPQSLQDGLLKIWYFEPKDGASNAAPGWLSAGGTPHSDCREARMIRVRQAPDKRSFPAESLQ